MCHVYPIASLGRHFFKALAIYCLATGGLQLAWQTVLKSAQIVANDRGFMQGTANLEIPASAPSDQTYYE
jgi:hypothetical protein